MKQKQPADLEQTLKNIRKVRQLFPAAVDSMGCSQCHDKTNREQDQRFQILVSLMLSSQTKDPLTWAAVQRLKEVGFGNVDGMLGAKEKDIEDLIKPVSFYRRKAIYLKKVAKILKEDYSGDIPSSVELLCKLPGVGPKMAHLCMLSAWDELTGIGVDTHVHRIAARLGWVPEGLKKEEDTRKALESWLPREHWREINHLLVGFGQTICTAKNPRCEDCFNNTICPSSTLGRKGRGTDNSKPVATASAHDVALKSKEEETSFAIRDPFDFPEVAAEREVKIESEGTKKRAPKMSSSSRAKRAKSSNPDTGITSDHLKMEQPSRPTRSVRAKARDPKVVEKVEVECKTLVDKEATDGQKQATSEDKLAQAVGRLSALARRKRKLCS